MTYQITTNYQYNSREVYFDGKPAEAVRDALKALRMRWNHKKSCWYGYASESQIADAIASGTPAEEAADTVTIGEGYLGGGAVYGSKSNLYLHGSDLSAAIRADIKAAGIKGVTVRCKTYSGGQSVAATVQVKPSDFISREQFIDAYQISPSTAWIETGSGSIHRDAYWESDADEQTSIREAAAAWEYEQYSQHERGPNHNYLDNYKMYTPEAIERFRRVIAIVSAYNYDESNAMVDYFNTNFYFDIYSKPVNK